MKKTFQTLLIAFVVLIQIGWFVLPQHNSLMGESFRNKQRLEALKANANDPSLATQASVAKELDLLSNHAANRHIATFAIILLIDGLLLVCILKTRTLNRANKSDSCASDQFMRGN
jgi:hypothetical protein